MITIYPYENVIQYHIKDQIKEFIVSKKAMQYGKIKNIPIFEKELGRLIKKEGWVGLLKSKSITLILPVHYTELDKEIFTILFNNNGIKKIKYKRAITLLDLKKNKIYVEIHESYALLIKKEKNKTILFYPLNIYKNLEDFLSCILNHSQKNYLIYGSHPEMINKIVFMKQKNVFYYQSPKTYLISKYIP